MSGLDRRARTCGKDRARDREDEVVSAYRSGSVSLSQAASLLGIDVWAYFDVLSRRGETINVTLEDWIDSESSL